VHTLTHTDNGAREVEMQIAGGCARVLAPALAPGGAGSCGGVSGPGGHSMLVNKTDCESPPWPPQSWF